MATKEPTTKDEIFEEICTLVEAGAAPTACAPEVRDMLHARYFAWIDTVQAGNSQSPMDVWGQGAGAQLKQKFREIGQAAAKKSKENKKDKVDSTEGTTAYRQVEAESDCPFCPPPEG